MGRLNDLNNLLVKLGDSTYVIIWINIPTHFGHYDLEDITDSNKEFIKL